MKKQVGVLDQNVISLLKLNIPVNTPVYLGDSNVAHMKSHHFDDFQKYGGDISSILSSPDYVGLNPKDSSIEYVKEYRTDNAFVKVAVRVSLGNNYFVRSLYTLNNNRVQNFISKGTLKRY